MPGVDAAARIAGEQRLSVAFVAAALELFQEGATIPFVARYRKERTGAMDETVLQIVRDRAEELAALDKRRAAILSSLTERNVLTKELQTSLDGAESLSALEDIYLPYRPKRKTRASAARDAGLEPLALAILDDGSFDPASAGKPAALSGAKDIIAEWISEDSMVRAGLRDLFQRSARFHTRRARASSDADPSGVYADYYEWSAPVAHAPSHRVLAILRGVREKVLSVHALPPEEAALDAIWRAYVIRPGRSGTNRARRQFLEETVADAYKRLLSPALEKERIAEAKIVADRTAAAVFAANLRDLFMEAPAGRKAVLAVDPGFRTGCKVVCLDASGELVHHETIYPLEPQRRTDAAAARIRALLSEYQPAIIAVGNGTGGREAEAFLRAAAEGAPPAEGAPGAGGAPAAKGAPGAGGVPAAGCASPPPVVMVDESGASIYSASALARAEFPQLDLTVRGAISIGRRLMDPMAELVKLDPASIGVGQYQHDVDSALLRQSLDDTVQSCVSSVGVDLNLAGTDLLQYVAGLTRATATKIVSYRKKYGPFRSREALNLVAGIGARTVEQAAGFLRVRGGENPLDESAVHPERYALVTRMAADLGVSITDLIGNEKLTSTIQPERYVSDEVGLPTLQDILRELARPGLDPRPVFEEFSFSDSVHTIEDLKPGQVLSGRVTNVTDFGAFIDIGVHRDGLVHISRMAGRFVKDPRTVVRVHQTVTVSVVEVDGKRNRISLALEH